MYEAPNKNIYISELQSKVGMEIPRGNIFIQNDPKAGRPRPINVFHRPLHYK